MLEKFVIWISAKTSIFESCWGIRSPAILHQPNCIFSHPKRSNHWSLLTFQGKRLKNQWIDESFSLLSVRLIVREIKFMIRMTYYYIGLFTFVLSGSDDGQNNIIDSKQITASLSSSEALHVPGPRPRGRLHPRPYHIQTGICLRSSQSF